MDLRRLTQLLAFVGMLGGFVALGWMMFGRAGPPPTPEQALGPIHELPRVEQRAFAPTAAFAPMPAMHLCPVCLRKLQVALGFDPVQRYRDLAGLYAVLGLRREQEWVERRLEFILEPPEASP